MSLFQWTSHRLCCLLPWQEHLVSACVSWVLDLPWDHLQWYFQMGALSHGANIFSTGYRIHCSAGKRGCVPPPMQKVFQSHVCILPFILLTLIISMFTLYQQRATFSPCFFCTFAHLLFFSQSCCWFWPNAIIGRRLFLEKSFFFCQKKPTTYAWTILILSNTGALIEWVYFAWTSSLYFVKAFTNLHVKKLFCMVSAYSIH